MDALQSWGWAVLMGRALVVGLMALGLVWCMEKVNAWADYRQRDGIAERSKLVVQRLVECEDFVEGADIGSEDGTDIGQSIAKGQVWQECPAFRGQIVLARTRFPQCQYRLVVVPPQTPLTAPSPAATMGVHAPHVSTHNARR